MRLGMVENGAADTFGAVLADEVRAFDVLFDVGGDLCERLLAGVLLRDVNEGAVLAAQLAEVAAALAFREGAKCTREPGQPNTEIISLPGYSTLVER